MYFIYIFFKYNVPRSNYNASDVYRQGDKVRHFQCVARLPLSIIKIFFLQLILRI
jgi:hypothetical protein